MFAGSAFYRGESAQGRDLAVLAAAVYRKQHGQLRVLDVMAGSGMRGARYIQQVCTDSNPATVAVVEQRCTAVGMRWWQLHSLVV
jgi:tRNA (guanine26-N2/guanine27-N2)-dimethyltransferase